MRRFAITVATLVIALAAAGCGSSTGSHGTVASPAPSAANPQGKPPATAVKCQGQPWPQPLPDFTGQPLAKTVVGTGLCFDITAVNSTEGHDVMHDPASYTIAWTIVSQSPAPGTSVASDTPVTLTVGKP